MSKKDQPPAQIDADESALTKCLRETRSAVDKLILAHDCRLLLACLLSEAGKIGGDAVRSGTVTMADVRQYFSGSLVTAHTVAKNGKPVRVTNGVLDTKTN